MTRPSAPCLTADYHTYAGHSTGDDYYGGFELDRQKTKYTPNSVPMRRGVDDAEFRSQKERLKISSTVHCISFGYLVLSLMCLGCSYAMYYYGIKNKIVFYFASISIGMIVSSALMHIGIIRNQPFFCIPFLVLRILETVFNVCFLLSFIIAILDQDGDVFLFYLQCNQLVIKLVSPNIKLEVVDATTQLCMIGFCVFLTMLSVSLYICRVSFQCTVSIADQVRYKRCLNRNVLSQSRSAGDEFYYS